MAKKNLLGDRERLGLLVYSTNNLLKDGDDSGDDKSGRDQGQCKNVYENAEFFGQREGIRVFIHVKRGLKRCL